MRAHRALTLAAAAALAAFPLLATALGQEFYVNFGTRILAYALAATSLNLVLGYGGMVSFGHAAFFGAGGYTVAILMAEGVPSAWIAWPAAVLVSGVLAAGIGAVSLRTRGVYFIMITLAFAQMIYYVAVSAKRYGAEDGINLATRSAVGFGLDPASDTALYYVAAAVFAACLYCLHRLVHSRFGRVVQAIRENETRMEAIGFATYRYKLACFAIAGAIAGLAGAIAVNQPKFASPVLLDWVMSGQLMIMVILGGVGRLWGGAIGAFTLLVLEEVLQTYTIYWQLPIGVVLLAVVLFAPQGLAGLAGRRFSARGAGDG
jgi:branched-chain amino acid transport system permease protein